MTREQLELTEIKNDHGNFFPSYTYEEVEVEINGEKVIEYDYTITVTAEENYQKYLNPPVEQLDKISTCLKRLDLQEESTLDIDYRLTLMELCI